MASRRAAPKRDREDKVKLDFTKVAKTVVDVGLDEFIPTTYFPYAVSVILDRALTGEDGLLPVQKRILWAMYVNHVYPTSEYGKVLSIMGDVSKYHPHGDASIEASIVRMAQPFSLRVLLVDGHGNFASIPGDEASAPRYIDARLSKAAMDSLEELKYNAVTMGKNYTGKLDEPTQLPVRFPISVINGAQGIAVGFATNMPQHNPTEAMKVAHLLLRNPDASLERIRAIMPGPDFKTGGIVLGTSGIQEYYRTGRGSLTIRAKYRIEQGKGGRSTIVFYEVPPGISIDQCRSAINEIVDSETYKDSKDKKKAKKYKSLAPARKALNGISRTVDLTDFETGNGVDFEVELKASANPKAMVVSLFKYTPLQSRFAVNNTVVYNDRPQTVGIRELFLQFLNYRRRCVTNVNKTKKETAEHRIKIIDGILSILLDLDKAVRIIRSSKDDDTAKTKLKKGFGIDDEQAEYILSLQLRRLTRQNADSLKLEKKGLVADVKTYTGILSDPKKLDDEVDRLLVETSKIIGDKRYMEILDATDEEIAAMDKDMKISAKMDSKDSPCLLTILPDGHIVRTLGDKLGGNHYRSFLKTTNKHRALAIGDDGVGYALEPSALLENGKVDIHGAFGMPDGVSPVGVVSDGSPILTVASNGYMKITKDAFGEKWTSHPIQGLKSKDARIVAAIPLPEFGSGRYDKSEVVVVTTGGHVIRFSLGDANPTGFGAAGVIAVRLGQGDSIATAVTTDTPGKDVITTLTGITAKSTPISGIPLQKRAGAGVILQRTAGSDKVVDAMLNGLVLVGRRVTTPKPTGRDRPALPTGGSARLVAE